ncbi:MAG: hypothetical protein F9K46_11485 [Anaerolineae bacterium]|nr:MAG: hypothetical protein F9K46_11485 [Anaerolineae bacterium]
MVVVGKMGGGSSGWMGCLAAALLTVRGSGFAPVGVAMTLGGVESFRRTPPQSVAKARQLNRWLALACEGAGTALQSAPLCKSHMLAVLRRRGYGTVGRR